MTNSTKKIYKNNDITMIIPIKSSDFKYIERLVPLAKENIGPKEIFVISAKEVEEKCAHIGVKFIDENKLVPNLDFGILKQKMHDLTIDTSATGWYLQQFLKLGFASICKTKYYVSWDADMLPIRKIKLFDESGKPFFTLKKEYLQRYFVTLKRLLNIDKTRKESFIAEHMVFDVNLVKEMLEDIQEIADNNASFWENILYATLPESHNDAFAFSEFETYGNWVEKKHPEAYATRKLNMFRHAKYYFGENPKNKEIAWAAKDFDTLSFEHFDTQIISPLWLQGAIKNTSFKKFLQATYPLLDSEKQKMLDEFDWFWGDKTVYEKTIQKNVRPTDKLKILFDSSLINNFNDKSRARTGIYWVSFNILEQLAMRSDIEVYLYSGDMQKTKAFVENYAKKLPHLYLFSGDIKDMDLYLSSFNQIPNEIKKTNIPCFTLIYDCIPMVLPEYFEVCKDWFPALLKSFTINDYCFSISEYTKKDFLKYCPWLDAKKITTIPLSTNQPYKPNKNLTTEIRKKYNIPTDKKYLFSLCSLEPRKNLIRAVKTFIQFIEKNKIDDLVFVLGGGAYEGFIERFEKEVPDFSKYKDKIIRAGYVDDEDMEVLYSNAEWFVYTSQYEGFGMPPLEAMACGTAVITSNNSSLPEVVGDAGIMIDWDSDEQHVAAYEKYYFDKKFRDKMAKKGLERSKQFSWEKAADIMVEQFKKCHENPNRTSLLIDTPLKNSIKPSDNNQAIKTMFKLFNFLPIFSYKRVGGRNQWKIFGLPIFKTRHMANGITSKYYILGIPVLKVSKKSVK